MILSKLAHKEVKEDLHRGMTAGLRLPWRKNQPALRLPGAWASRCELSKDPPQLSCPHQPPLGQPPDNDHAGQWYTSSVQGPGEGLV